MGVQEVKWHRAMQGQKALAHSDNEQSQKAMTQYGSLDQDAIVILLYPMVGKKACVVLVGVLAWDP